MSLRLRRPSTSTVLMLLVGLGAVVAVAGLHAVFSSWSFIWCALAGAATATAVEIVAAERKLLIGESVALALAALTVVGIAVAGGPHNFFAGLVGAWADLISATQPADLTAQLRVVPLVLAWFGALVGGELVRWTRLPSLPAVGPLLALSLAVLLSAEDRGVAVAQGATLATIALAIGVIQQRALRRSTEIIGGHTEMHRRRRIGRVVAMLAIVAAVAPFIGPRLPLADAHERYDLRNNTTPPWDPLAVPSPLVELKGSLAEARKDEVVFRVSADAPLDRWQVAVLGDYDGLVWTVGSANGTAAASEFRPVDTRLPRAPADVRDREAVHARVDVVDLTEPWLPSPGWPTAVNFADGVGAAGPLRANLRTGTLALTDGVPAGTSYEISAYASPQLGDQALLKDSIITTAPDEDQLAELPPPVKNLAADLLEGQDVGWQQVATVRDSFRNSGFYDSTQRTAPGHSYFRLSEFLADPKRIVGYEEQYAAAAAVIFRSAQLPARVVVGYRIPADRWVDGSADVHAGDISAWVEVHLEGAGWVPVDVTPDRTRTPTAQQQGTVFQDVAVPNPPPPPPIPPNVQVLPDDRDDQPDDTVVDTTAPTVTGGASWGGGRVALASGGGLVLLLVALAGGIVLIKLTRRRRRRTAPVPAERVAGAWLELADRCREASVPLHEQATPLEAARAYLGTERSATEVRTELLALVAEVDRAAYHPQPPADAQAEHAWNYCDRVVDALVHDRSPARRLTMRLDPRTLRRRDPVAKSEP